MPSARPARRRSRPRSGTRSTPPRALADKLSAEGRAVRFDVHKLDGGVVASLVDDEGGMLRPLLLEDVVDVGRLSHEAGQGVAAWPAFRSAGIASGMDTESIITQLMSIESAPRTRTARQQVTVQARQDALRQIDSKLTNLKLAAGDLRSAAIWTPTQAIVERQRERPHRAPARRRRPRRLHGQRLLAGQRRLAHLRLATAAAA